MPEFPNNPEDVANNIFNIDRHGKVRNSVDLPFEIGEVLEQAFGGDDTIAVLFSEFGRLVKVRKHFGRRNRTIWRGDIYLIILEIDNEILDIYNGWNPFKGAIPDKLTMPKMSYRDIFKRGTFKTLENQGQNIDGLFQGNHQTVIEFVKSLLSKADLEWAERNNR